MKKLVADSAKCTGCGACEDMCSLIFYEDEDREKSAIRVTPNDDGGHNIAVCDQCGACMWMCSAVALTKADSGVVELNKKTCVGCLICVAECKRGYFFYNDDLPTPFKCIACGICAMQCPTGALAVKEVN